MVRLASIFFGAAGLVAGKQFSLTYYIDGNCTVPANVSISGPQDVCINTTAAGSAVSADYKAAEVNNCHAGANYTMTIIVDQAACPSTGYTGSFAYVSPVQTSGCTYSTSTTMYYLATCDAGTFSGNAATFTITTTHAPISDGSFFLKYYTDSSCTIPFNMSGLPAELGGPMGQCLNTTKYTPATALGGLYKVAYGGSCDGSKFTVSYGAADDCYNMPTSGDAPTNMCLFSTTLQQYFYATCSSATYADTTFTIATTHAPTSQGSFGLQYFDDNACTQPFNISGADVKINGPMGKCINVTATGSPIAAVAYKAAHVVNCDGSKYDMYNNMGADNCDSVTGPSPAIVGACTFSQGFQKYYLATCDSTAWTDTTIIITTTHAPISDGSWSLKYYTDSSCTIPYNMSGLPVEISGPMGQCLNVTKSGSPLAAGYKIANSYNCTGHTFKMDTGFGYDCGTMTTNPVVANQCLFSATLQQYFLATCSTGNWTGADITVSVTTTTTGAAATTIAATTIAATTVAATTAASSDTAATTAAPKIQASYESTEDLPASTTASDLMASTVYMTAKQTGLATALGVAPAKVTIDGFVISSRRLADKGRRLASKTVVTSYTVEVTATTLAAKQTLVQSNTIAATIQSETATAMSAADWSAEPVLTAAPTVTVTASTFVGTVAPTAAATPSTSFAMDIGSLSMATGALTAVLMLF